VAIRPTITNASSSLRKIPENKRQCIFANEKYLKFYRTYKKRNCALECEANYTLAMCMCVPYYLPSRLTLFFCKFFKPKGFLNNREQNPFNSFSEEPLAMKFCWLSHMLKYPCH
jgi:hypothetical protein